MFKGVDTQVEFQECIDKGLCGKHLQDVDKKERAAVKNEFSRNAFNFVRINILYPLLFKKSPKCEKIKRLMGKTPPIAKIFTSELSEVADVIFVMDSVVIFTMCQLSKICCVGALFHTKKSNSEDPHIKSIQNLLLAERFENADIRYLYPLLQKNFVDCDLDIIRATHCITLLFIRKFCNKSNLKIAIEAIKTEMNSPESTVEDPYFKTKGNLYCCDYYEELADHFLKVKAYLESTLFSHLAISLDFSTNLGRLQLHSFYPLKEENKILGKMPIAKVIPCSSNKKCSGNNHLTHDERIPFMKEKINSVSVDLVDSDSTGSDLEPIDEDKEKKEELNVKDENNENNEKKNKDNKSKLSGHAKKSNEENMSIKELIERGKKSPSPTTLEKGKKSPTPPVLEKGKKSPTPPVICNKEKDLPKKKRTISESSVSSLVEAELDISKINSFLKEASEALLVDCGYKAVQIFRGPLRSFIESLDSSKESLPYEECDIVCIKYSYGIAYCKSGGCDDLQKSITIFKDIIENHDSITFPAAYYSVGLSYRKLNRFKDALTYLENVQNFLHKGIHFKVYPWPGINTVIQETKPEVLKTLVEDLVSECENPPNPDAYCRYEKCCFQPSIYYSDPDFKGYISVFCSLQCLLQYHFQCWKSIKEEKELTEKDFLEKPCFTPDCEGLIAKIQNIDKKGILSKEFASEIKKPLKQKRNRNEKKTEVKEKKKKKNNNKSEDHSSEGRNENVRSASTSRKNSVADDPVQFLSTSQKNSIPDDPVQPLSTSRKNSVADDPVQLLSTFRKNSVADDPVHLLSESSSSTEDTSSKQSIVEKYPQNIEQEVKPCENVLNAVTKSECEESLQENSDAAPVPDDIKDFKLKSPDETEEESLFFQCIKQNIYSYMEDFLQRHGPLRIEDPVLLHEISSFPDEACEMISKSGGIGEFLKDDLRFAFVGNCYVCIVSDLGTAYKMFSSLPADFKNLQTFEGEDNTTYHTESYNEDRCSSVSLNPDAVEYTPTKPICNSDDSFKALAHSTFPQDCGSNFSLPASFESSTKCTNNWDTYGSSSSFSESINKTKSFETALNRKSPKDFVPAALLPVKPKLKDENTDKNIDESSCKLEQSVVNSNPKIDLADENTFEAKDEPEISTTCNMNTASSVMNVPAEFLEVEPELMQEMEDYLENLESEIKPFIMKKSDRSASVGTMTEVTMFDAENLHGKANPSEENTINELKAEISKLSSKNTALQTMLNYVTEQQQKQSEELTQTKKSLNNYISKIQNMEDDFEQKEQVLLSENTSLRELTKGLNESVQRMEKEIKSLTIDRNNCEIENISLKMEKDKIKNELNEQEKKYNSTVETLQKEKVELKNKAKYAELQVLNMKKNEVLRRIEDKSVEAAERQKELNASVAMMGANFNPVLLNYVKILSSKLITYTNNLSILKLDFLKKMDSYIREIENGASLKDLKLVEIKDLPAVPSWKNTFPNNPLTDNALINAAASPFNFNLAPQFPASPVSPPIPASGPAIGTSPSKVVQPTATIKTIQTPLSLSASAISRPPVQASSVSTNPSVFSIGEASKSDHKIDNVIDFANLNPNIQESFKSGMASINSFASSLAVPVLDDEFVKKPAVFNSVEPISRKEEDFAKKTIGIKSSEPTAASAMAINGKLMSRLDFKSSLSISEKLPYANLDTVPVTKPQTTHSASESEKKKNSYPKLLSKLKEQFPTYSEEELMSLVGEFRSQRQGKLTGLPINSIIAGISVIINTKKRALEQAKVQPKSKVLVNKKLVPDTKETPSVSEQPSVKRKTAWNIGKDSHREFTGSADDDCTICYDPMGDGSAYKVPCGHFFHEHCIRQWLNNQSNCPVCRVLLLLPEEYPSLK